MNGKADVINSILWQNASRFPHQIINLDGATVRVMASAVEHSGGSGEDYWERKVGTDAGGNIARNPAFVRAPSAGADGSWGTLDDDYGDLRLRSNSPALDAGWGGHLDLDNDGSILDNVPVDLYGLARIQEGAVDMGAYEGVAHFTRTAGDGYAAAFNKAGVVLAFNSAETEAEVVLTHNPVITPEGEDPAGVLGVPYDLSLVLPATWDIELKDVAGDAEAEVCFSTADRGGIGLPEASTVYKRPVREPGAWAAQETVVHTARDEVCAVRVNDGSGEYAVLVETVSEQPAIAAAASSTSPLFGANRADTSSSSQSRFPAPPREEGSAEEESAETPNMGAVGTSVASDMSAYEAVRTGGDLSMEAVSRGGAVGNTFVRYHIPFEAEVRLTLRDMLGRTVATLVEERQKAGVKNFPLKDVDIDGGVYVLRLEAGDQILTRRLVLEREAGL